jgi:hypothetical protein
VADSHVIAAEHFFTNVFDKLKASGAVWLDSEGKNAGCWVMALADTPEFAGRADPDTVIVRSDSTVTYSARTSPTRCGSAVCWEGSSATAGTPRSGSGRRPPPATRRIRRSAGAPG